MPKSGVNRRGFLKTSAAGAAAVSLAAATYNNVYGANDKIGVGFLGTGGRCQIHLAIINKLVKDGKGVRPVAVCDVWDGNEQVEGGGGRGLYPSAKKVGLSADDKKHVTKDYRRVLDLKEVDVIFIGAPDHWHAKMSIDAAAAGKDVYCEKPMTKTIDEAHAVVDAMKKHNRVMTVGVQSMTDPRWRMANEQISSGKIGKVAQAQTSYYRNSDVGQWRYYKLTKDMTPKTIDWNMFLGHDFHIFKGEPLGPKIPFDRAVYGQWRCYWPFGGGMFTDLFVHQTTHMVTAMGVKYPRRVVGGGGLYLEYDGRDVPDVATVVADYDEGCQLIITATMISSYPIEEVIRGHLGTIKFLRDGFEVVSDLPNKAGPGLPARMEETVAEATFNEMREKGIKTNAVHGKYVDAHPPKWSPQWHHADTEALWLNFLDCVRGRKRETLSTPELGAIAFTTVNMGVQSYRQGRALYWNKDERKVENADSSWASNWEKRSKEHGKPSHVDTWHAGQTGSLLHPPAYQKLAGPWIGGKDPAENHNA